MTPVPSSLQNRTFHVITFGCQMNKHDSERIVGMLEDAGARRVDRRIRDRRLYDLLCACSSRNAPQRSSRFS